LNTWSVSVVTNCQKSHLIVKLAEQSFVKTVFINCQERPRNVHAVKRNYHLDLRPICVCRKSLTNLRSCAHKNVDKESRRVIWKCMLINIVLKNFSSVQNAEKRWRKTSLDIILQENIRTQCSTNFWSKKMKQLFQIVVEVMSIKK